MGGRKEPSPTNYHRRNNALTLTAAIRHVLGPRRPLFFGTTRRKRTISFWRRRYASYRSRGASRDASRYCSGLPRENREEFDDRSPRLKRPPLGKYRPPGVQIFFKITRRRTPTSYFQRRDASAARKTTNGGATGTNFLSSDSA